MLKKISLELAEFAYSSFEVYFTLDYLGVELTPSSIKTLL